MLFSDEKEIKRIVKEFMELSTEIKASARSEFEVQILVENLRKEHLLLFHVGEIRYKFYPRRREVFLYPEYIMPGLEYQNKVSLLLNEVGKIKNLFLPYTSQMEVERGVHDYLCKHIKYAEDDLHSHSVVGPLLRGRGVCDGISKTAKMLFQVLGVEAHVIDGMAKNAASFSYESHAWNIVRINQRWHHLDVTFDNTLSGDFIRYDYFNLSEKEISKDHIKGSNILFQEIVCNEAYDYFQENGLYFSNLVSLEEYLRRCLLNRKNGYIQLRVSENIEENEVTRIFEQCLRKTGCSFSYQESINPTRRIFVWNVEII